MPGGSGVMLSGVGLFQPGLLPQTSRTLGDLLDFELPEVGGRRVYFPHLTSEHPGRPQALMSGRTEGGRKKQASVERVTGPRFSLRNSFPLGCQNWEYADMRPLQR